MNDIIVTPLTRLAGLSAYEIAVRDGSFVGTEQQWLASLKGEPGGITPELEQLRTDVQERVSEMGDVTSEGVAAVVTEPGPARDALSAAYVPKESVYVKDFLVPGATRAQNRTAYQAAVLAAESNGRAVCYDGAFFEFEGAPIISSVDDAVHWATSEGTHKVTNVTVPLGVLRVQGERSLISHLYLDGANPQLIFPAGITEGNGWWSSAVFVEPSAHDTTIVGGRCSGFMYAVVGGLLPYDLMPTDVRPSPEQVAVEANFPALKNLTIDGLFSDGCWTAYQPLAVDVSTVRNLHGWYQNLRRPDGSVAPSEPHLVYLGGWSSGDTPETTWRWGKNYSLENLLCTSGESRHVYRARAVKGLTVSGLRAVDSPGLFQFINCEDVQIGLGCRSDRDRLANNDEVGSAHLLNCRRVYQAPVTISFASDVMGSRGGGISNCEDVRVDRIRVIANDPSYNGTSFYGIYGINPRCELVEPEFISRGAGRGVGILAGWTSGQTEPARARILRPKISGVVLGILVSNTGYEIDYEPDEVQAAANAGTSTAPHKVRLDINSIGGVKLLNSRLIPLPKRDQRIISWLMGERLHTSDTSVWSKTPTGVYRAVTAGTVNSDEKGRIDAVSGSIVMAAYSLGTPDIDVTADVKGDASVGIALRANASNVVLALVRRPGSIDLVKRNSSVTTLVTVPTSIPAGVFATLRAMIVGNTIMGFLNGVQVLTHTLTGGDETLYTSNWHGLYAAGTGVETSSWVQPVFRTVA